MYKLFWAPSEGKEQHSLAGSGHLHKGDTELSFMKIIEIPEVEGAE